MFNPENIKSKKDDDVRSEEKNDIQNEEGVDITSDENGDIRREEGIDVPCEEIGNVRSEDDIDNGDATDINNEEPYTLDTSTTQQRIQILSAILEKLNNHSNAYNNSVPNGQAASATAYLFAPDPSKAHSREETTELYKKIAEEAAQLPSPEFIRSPANSPRSYTEEVAITSTLEENNETNELFGHAYLYTCAAPSMLSLPAGKARRSFIPRAMPQVAELHSFPCSIPRIATLYSFDENAVSNQKDKQASLDTIRNTLLMEMIFSIQGVKESILSPLPFFTRKNLRLTTRNINNHLWEVRRDTCNQHSVIYAKRIVILYDGYEVQIIFFVKRNGKLIVHLTDYKNSEMREIVLPKNEVAKEIAHFDNKSYCSQIISESGNCYMLLYFIENHRIENEKFIALSPQKMQIDKEKIRQALSIRGDLQFLTGSGDIHWFTGVDETMRITTVIVPRPDHSPVREVCYSCRGSMLALTELGQILIYDATNIDQLIKTNPSLITPLTLFPLSDGVKIKKFADIAIDASSTIIFVISEQGDLYLLDIEDRLSTLVPMPNNEKVEQVFMANGCNYAITVTGALYELGLTFILRHHSEDTTKMQRIPQFTITPIPLPHNEKAKQGDVCYGSALVVTHSGRVLTCGSNTLGELALGHKNPVPLPVYLNLLELNLEDKKREFYELLSSQHLKWFNTWLDLKGSDFDNIIELLTSYVHQTRYHIKPVFTLSEQAVTQPAYIFLIQDLINKCLDYLGQHKSSDIEIDCFNYFIEQLRLSIPPETLDRKSDLYALLEVIQLETNRAIISMSTEHNNSVTTQSVTTQPVTAKFQTEQCEEVPPLRPPGS